MLKGTEAAVRRVLKNGAKELGSSVLTTMDDASSSIKAWHGTTVPPLDVILTGEVGRGLPSGRIIELYGDEHVGKTTLGCLLLAEMQRNGGVAVVFDTEGTLTVQRAAQLGCNTASLIYGEERYVEDVLYQIEYILQKIGNDTPALVVWDTIAGTQTRAEQGRKPGEKTGMAEHARALSIGLRRLGKPLSQSMMTVLAVNQLKAAGFGKLFATEREQEATLGGRAMRFHTHSRVRLKAARKFAVTRDKRAVTVGDEVKVMVTKDKDRPSNVRGRDAILVLQKIGEGGGRFAAGYSCLRTLQLWGALPKGSSVKFVGKKYTVDTWNDAYLNDVPFQMKVHRAVELAHARLLNAVDRAKLMEPEKEEELV